MKLKTRFTLAIGGLVGVLFLLYTTALVLVERRHLVQEAERNHWLTAEHLALACNDALLTQDELGLVDFMNGLKKNPEVLEAYCVEPDGRMVMHTDFKLKNARWPDSSPPALAEKTALSREGVSVWAYSAPVRRLRRPVATARVLFNGDAVTRRLRDLLRQTARRLSWLTLVFLGISALLSSFLARALTRPIGDVVQGARRVGQGDLAARVWERGPGELGDLGREFNAMARKLGDLEEMKDSFIRTVSHDLRNPLSAIATSANVLRTDDLPPSSRPLLEVIESSAVRLRTMVNNILDVAKIREGHLTFERTVFPVDTILKELARLFLPMAKESDKRLRLDLPDSLPPLNADEEKVMRIFLNLLSNAFKFTRDGDTIAISAAPAGNGLVEFRVADTGLGIDPRRRESVFEPFRGVEGADDVARRRQGAGLGLSIVKTLVEGHGGRVRLESDLGKGTTVFFTLPAGATVS